MTKRPSLRELLGVWVAGVAAEILGWILVEDAGVMTAEVALGGSLFVLTPLFLVVYSVVWAWPWAAAGDRVVISGLSLFAVVVHAVSGWFWVGVQLITLATVVMRLLSVVSLVVFAACALSAAWAYRRRAHSWSAANESAHDPRDPPGLDSARRLGV